MSMSTTFLHTADWQLGKPFAGIEDVQKRSLVQQERINVLARIAEVAREHQAQFVVVAGDMFDSPSATKATVSAACSAIGAMKIPVFAIPGNHDHGGPGSVWEQDYFRRECSQLAPNFKILLTSEPVELENSVLFPCPLLKRHESTDPTNWLRSAQVGLERFGDKTRIVLAHGSVQGFAAQDDDEPNAGLSNQIDLSRVSEENFDYIALGDWHGAKQIGSKAWYSGTPELDRFPKGADHDPGNILAVTVQRGGMLEVRRVRTARFGWHELAFRFSDDAGPAQLEERIAALIGNRAGQDLLRLEVAGSLGLDATTRLEHQLESLQARLLRLALLNQSVVAPSQEEIERLTRRTSDPLLSRVAAKLVAKVEVGGHETDVARIALRELHAACTHN